MAGGVVCGYLQGLGVEGDLAKEEQLATKGTDERNRSQLSTARYPSPGIVERSLQRKICRLAGLLIALSVVPAQFSVERLPDLERLPDFDNSASGCLVATSGQAQLRSGT
jgi:hypothetical protein